MLWFKALHIIAMVAWFAGLFYLPRLFVYHADAKDLASIQRFKIMERRLYFGIMWPAAVLTSVFGGIIVTYAPDYYLGQKWFHWKLLIVTGLWVYHLYCAYLLKLFANDQNAYSSGYYRFFNEIPTVILVVVVFLVVLKP
jgi:protoporphyrinogen IX oxidase